MTTGPAGRTDPRRTTKDSDVQDLTISLIQTELHWQDPAANRAMLAELVGAAAEHADLIALPEMFTTGFTMTPAGLDEAPGGSTENWLREIAERHSTAVCGSLIVADNGSYHNRLLFARPGRPVEHYDKRHLFRMAGEDREYAAGKRRLVVEVGDWRVCPLICYDLRFPVWSRNRDDYDLLLYVANWPAARHSAWRTLLPARAVENLCYAAGVNRVGHDGNDVAYAGGSLVADYLGGVLADGANQAGIVSATLSGAKLTRYREKFPAWKDADAFVLRDDDAT